MLEIKEIWKTFNAGTVNEKQALRGVSLTLKDGDFCTVIGGNGGGSAARRCASRARAASTHPALHSRNSIARRAETPQGNDRRTHPVPRTLIEIRRARRDWERTTSPSRGCSTVVIMPNGP